MSDNARRPSMNTLSRLSSLTRILGTLPILFFLAAVQVTEADEPAGTPPSYGDTMEWIQTKLETWGTVDFYYSTNETTQTFSICTWHFTLTRFDRFGGITVANSSSTSGTRSIPADPSRNFSFDLSTATNVTTTLVAARTNRFVSNGESYFVYYPAHYCINLDRGIVCFLHDNKSDVDRVVNAFKHAIDLVKKHEQF
jgi:hypothetical protein